MRRLSGQTQWTWSGSEYQGRFGICKLLVLHVHEKQELHAKPPFVSKVCPVNRAELPQRLTGGATLPRPSRMCFDSGQRWKSCDSENAGVACKATGSRAQPYPSVMRDTRFDAREEPYNTIIT